MHLRAPLEQGVRPPTIVQKDTNGMLSTLVGNRSISICDANQAGSQLSDCVSKTDSVLLVIDYYAERPQVVLSQNTVHVEGTQQRQIGNCDLRFGNPDLP